jgi:hypothetical protein
MQAENARRDNKRGIEAASASSEEPAAKRKQAQNSEANAAHYAYPLFQHLSTFVPAFSLDLINICYQYGMLCCVAFVLVA